MTANTPPADAQVVDGAPDPQAQAAGAEGGQPTDSESAVQRNYELGREVAVTSTRAGGLVKLSVAVAVSDAALEAAKPLTAEELENLVSAAVGADPARGDQVQVVVSAFESRELPELAFYEQGWFATALRYATALLAVLLVLLLAVRPLIKRMRDPAAKPDEDASEANSLASGQIRTGIAADIAEDAQAADFPKKIELARQLAATQPDRAVEALQRMLETPQEAKSQ